MSATSKLNRAAHKRVKTKAYCPLCEKTHIVYLNWIGNGIPRMNCEVCQKVNAKQEGYIYGHITTA